MGLLAFLIIGLLAGAMARLLMPGNQNMGTLATIALGCVGSFVGGILGSLWRSDGHLLALRPSGLIASTIGAFIVLLVVGGVRKRI